MEEIGCRTEGKWVGMGTRDEWNGRKRGNREGRRSYGM